MRRKAKKIAAIVSTVVAGILSPGAVQANTATWLVSSGDYSVGAYWNGSTGGNGTVPTAADSADVTNAGTCIISSTDTIAVAQLWAGDAVGSKTGTINQTGGTVNANTFIAVGHGGSTGIYNFSGGVLNETGTAAADGVRIFGLVKSGAAATVMLMSDSTGTNTGTVLTDASEFDVGYSGAAATGAATLNLSGGTINVTNSGNEFAVGNGNGSIGIMNMTGGILNATSQIWIGEGTSSTATGGTGTFNLSAGTVNSSNYAVIGRGSSGTVGLSSGSLNISGTGTFIHSAGSAGDFQVGSQGININATLNLSTGGTLITDHISDQSSSGTQIINFNGGTLQANASDANFIRTYNSSAGNQVPTLAVGNGGAIFNTASYTMGIQLPLVHSSAANPTDGGVTVTGSGALLLGGSNTYTGATQVSGGTLNLLGSLISNIDVGPGAAVGTFNASGTATGSTTGALNFNGSSTLLVNPTGSQFLTIGGAANASSASVRVLSTITAAPGAPTEVLYAEGGIVGTTGAPGSGANFVPGVRGSLSIVPDPSSIGQDLVLIGAGPANLIWTGTAANPTFWDNQVTPNWFNTATSTADLFYTNDNVTFDDSASTYTVAIQGTVIPTSVTFNNSAHAYSLTGPGSISGSTGLTVSGGGLVTVTSSNSYTGATLIQNGTLAIGTGGSLGNASAVTIGSGSSSGVLMLGDVTGPVSQTITGLSSSGAGSANAVIGGNSSLSTLTVKIASGSTTFAGTIGSGISGTSNANALSLVKSGAGTLALAGSNTYIGGTTVNAGILNVSNNSALGSGNVTFTGAGGGTAYGTGNSTLQAGANVTVANNLSLGTASVIFDTGGNTLTLSGAITNTPTAAAIIQPIGTGNLILSGTLNVTGATTASSGDSNTPALFLASQGNTTTITGSGNMSSISLGFLDTSNTLILSPSGTLTLTDGGPTLAVGQQNGSGSVIFTTGTLNITNNLNLGMWDTSYGSFNMTGGTLTVNNIYSGGQGNGNSSTYFLQSGGTTNVTSHTTLGVAGNGSSVAYLTGGTFNELSSNFIIQGGIGGASRLTIAGATVNVQTITLASNVNDSTTSAELNLNSGLLNTNYIKSTSALADSILNFNGATLQANASSGMFVNFLTTANVYSGGAVFNTAGQSITVGQNLLTAGGTGGFNTSSVSIGTSGTGYIAPPVVSISGGGGIGATAVATVSGGQVTGIIITNPGTGYTYSPTFNLIGGGGSGASISASPIVNAADGGLTKSGAGTLTLSGSNTYTGGTQVTGGTLAVANSGALGHASVTLSGGGALALSALPPLVSITPNSFTTNTNTATSTGFTPIIGSNGRSILLTSAIGSEATSSFNQNSYTFNDSTGFVASFIYNHATIGALNSGADGVTFTVTGASPFALGAPGGAIGYAGVNATTAGIGDSVAAAVDLYQDQIETGVNGFWQQSSGANTVPFISMSYSSLVTVSYAYNTSAGTGALTETITSLSNGSSYTMVTPNIDLAQILGGSPGGSANGIVGFTGGTGGVNDVQAISNFSFNPNSQTQVLSAVNIANPVSVSASASAGLQLAPTPGYSSGSVGAISIGTGGALAISVGPSPAAGVTHGVLTTPSITFSSPSSGTLDVANNALDITSESAAMVRTAIASAYQNGAWTGPGITSSTAASDSSHLTTLGMLVNNDGNGNTIYGTPTGTGTNLGLFDGSSPALNDVLVKYTYYGDANLDGAVDGSDYSLIDAGFNSGGTLTGWQNGDFNYDGKIDGSDYTLIDNAFNTQGASLGSNPADLIASSTAQIAGAGSAVPEPASLGLIGIAAAGLLRRRRRR